MAGFPDRLAGSRRGIVLAILCVLGPLPFLPGLRLETDLTTLLPTAGPAAEAFRRAREQGSAGEWLVLRLDLGGVGTEHAVRRAEDLRNALLSLTAVTLPEPPETAVILPLLAERERRERWRRELREGEFGARLDRTLRRLRVGGMAPAAEAFAHDPFGLVEELASIDDGARVDRRAASGIARGDDGLWIVLRSRVPAGVTSEREPFLKDVREVTRRWGADGADPAVELLGGYRYAQLAEAGIRGDLLTLLPAAVIGVFVTLGIGLRSWLGPITCLFPALCVVGWIGAWFAVMNHAAHPPHFAAWVMIVGLSVDAAIHLRVAARPGPVIGLRAWQRAGRGIRVALLTSVVGFLVLLISDFPAIRALGVTVAVGLAGAALILWLCFPALAKLDRPRATSGFEARGAARSRGHVRISVWAWILAAIILFAHLAPLPPLDFEGDLRRDDPWRKAAFSPLKALGSFANQCWEAPTAIVPELPARAEWREKLRSLVYGRGVREGSLTDGIECTLDLLEGAAAGSRRLGERGRLVWVPAHADRLSLEQAGFVRVDGGALLEEVAARSREELLSLGLWILLGVVACLSLALENRQSILVVLFPPIVALAGTLLLTRFLAHPVNPLGLTILPLLFGIGLDDAIHIVLSPGDPRSQRRVRRGVLLTTLTTLVALGTLVGSRSPAVRSLGELSIPAMAIAGAVSILGLRKEPPR